MTQGKCFTYHKQVNKVYSVPREPLVSVRMQEISKNASQHTLNTSKVTEHENLMSSLLRSFQCHLPQVPGPLSGFILTKYKVLSEPMHTKEQNGTHLYTDVYPCDGHKQTEPAEDFDDGKSDFTAPDADDDMDINDEDVIVDVEEFEGVDTDATDASHTSREKSDVDASSVRKFSSVRFFGPKTGNRGPQPV
jgi:hypothetical protein